MSERITVGGIQVDEVLYDFVNTEAIPGTGVDPDAFWAGVSEIFTDLAPRNRELLETRDALQSKIDAWHHENPAPIDQGAYTQFLRDIGYLVPEPDSVSVTTENVDAEIAKRAFMTGTTSCGPATPGGDRSTTRSTGPTRSRSRTGRSRARRTTRSAATRSSPGPANSWTTPLRWRRAAMWGPPGTPSSTAVSR